MSKPRKEKSGLCRWECGRKADNRSGICGLCWADRVRIAALRVLDEVLKPKRVVSQEQKDRMKAGKKLASWISV